MANNNLFVVPEFNPVSVVLGTVSWLVIITFLIFPITILLAVKCSVIALAYLLYDNLYSVSTTDAAFAIGCSWKKSKLSVGLLLRVNGQLELTQVQNTFYSKLLLPKIGGKPKYEKLYSCLVTFGGYVFRKLLPMDSIKLDNHIYTREMKWNEALENVIQDWMNKSYLEHSPAWELMIVPGPFTVNSKLTACDGEKRSYETALCFKIHHVFADGYSLLHILDVLTDNKSPYLVKDPMESFAKKVLHFLCLPVTIQLLGGDKHPKNTPIKIKNPQKYWRYTFSTVDLEPIKAIRKKYDVHFASVILTLTVGSIRKFMLDKHSTKKLPKFLVTADTLPLWPQHPALKETFCNHWALGVVKSPFSQDDPLERMLATEQDFVEFHNSGLQKVATNYLFPAAWLVPSVISIKALEKDQFGYNTGLTSLVGGNEYKILGQRVTHIYPLLTLLDSHPYTAFSWFTFSQSGKLDITLAAAPELFPDQTSLSIMITEYFQTELERLCRQCGISNAVTSVPNISESCSLALSSATS